ncbi:MAG: tetratricopeptide repeat protein, partial [Phycisphaeraceae bacterium]
VRRTLLCETLRPRFGRASSGIALTCALLWMVHPMLTECVNYISQRTESIMGLFYLLTLYCAIRAIGSDHRYRWHAASVFSCALGMASKEVMVTAPLMVLLYDLAFRSGSIRQVLRQRRGLYAGLAATWLVLAVLMWSAPRSSTVGFSHGVSASEYAMIQCVVIVHYLRLAVWPHPLVLDYGFPQVLPIHEVAPYAAFLAALVLATIAAFVYRPMIGFLGAWIFVILSPTSSFIPIATEVGAERRMYLSLAGLIVLIVIAGYVLLKRAGRQLGARGPTKAGWTGAGLIIVVAAVLIGATVGRNHDYRSPISIWQTVVQGAPRNPRGYNELGNALQLQGEFHEAISHYRHAILIKPDYVEAHNNLGTVLWLQGKLDEAISHYRQALKVKPDYALAHNNLGNVLQLQDKLDEAIHHYRQALRIKPGLAGTYSNLGIVLQLQGKLDEAIHHYREALRIKPDFAVAHSNLGEALSAQGKFDEAIRHYRQALRIKPDLAEAHNSLGDALRAQGKLDEAISHYRRALEIKPDYAAAVQNLTDAQQMKSQQRNQTPTIP